jgi:hypothetical protein
LTVCIPQRFWSFRKAKTSGSFGEKTMAGFWGDALEVRSSTAFDRVISATRKAGSPFISRVEAHEKKKRQKITTTESALFLFTAPILRGLHKVRDSVLNLKA